MFNHRALLLSRSMRKLVVLALFAGLLLPIGRWTNTAQAEAETRATDLTDQCEITLPERSASFLSRFTDDRYNSRVSFKKEESLTISVPSEAAGIYVAWYTAPESALVEMLDSAGTVLGSIRASAELLNDYYIVPQGCASVRISGEKAFAISELRVYDTETPPDGLAVMTAQKTQPDVMLILAHTADEAYYFGSLLPYCRSEDVAVVFLMSYSREAQQQAIELQYSLGSRTQPIFAGFQYYRSYMSSDNMYAMMDKEEITSYMLQLIRKYQPNVLVTHDIAGESGDCLHVLTATHVQLAAEQASQKKYDPESVAEYGLWQVQAVYQHRSDGTSALYDTQASLSEYGGLNAVELAQECFDRYTFLTIYRQSVQDTPYFEQTFPVVDPAVSAADSAQQLYTLLDGLLEEAGPLATVSPEPTATPTPTDTPEPAAAPVEDADAAVFGIAFPGLPVGIGLCLIGLTLLACFIVLQKKQLKTRGLRIGCVCAGALILSAGVILLCRTLPAQAAAPAATATPEPTETAAPTDTPEPTPTPTPEPFAEHFRQDGDPEEVVIFDQENGVYEYHSDTLGVEIKTYTQTDPPLVYHVAHIYMRDVDSYRSGFGSERQNGRDPLDACAMARRYRAVLGITGDNLLHSDYNRGLFIRNGRVFRSLTAVSCMVLTDDLSMRIYEKNDVTMLNEIEDGAWATYAFGPPLILNGELCEGVDDNRVGRLNPRAGLGLVEPGHFVAIVVDGRLPGYSHGILLSEYAKLFQQEGCVMAYNLDGGASATMVFMGEYINLRNTNHYRRVPDQLLWGYSELVPTEDDPYVNPIRYDPDAKD